MTTTAEIPTVRWWQFWRRRDPLAELPSVVADWQARQRFHRDEARLDRVIEMTERASMACLDCEIGEPHVCERQWWADRLAHHERRACSDIECPCHESLRLRQEAGVLWPTR